MSYLKYYSVIQKVGEENTMQVATKSLMFLLHACADNLLEKEYQKPF